MNFCFLTVSRENSHGHVKCEVHARHSEETLWDVACSSQKRDCRVEGVTYEQDLNSTILTQGKCVFEGVLE